MQSSQLLTVIIEFAPALWESFASEAGEKKCMINVHNKALLILLYTWKETLKKQTYGLDQSIRAYISHQNECFGHYDILENEKQHTNITKMKNCEMYREEQ